jgi:hypothetical protein
MVILLHLCLVIDMEMEGEKKGSNVSQHQHYDRYHTRATLVQSPGRGVLTPPISIRYSAIGVKCSSFGNGTPASVTTLSLLLLEWRQPPYSLSLESSLTNCLGSTSIKICKLVTLAGSIPSSSIIKLQSTK